MSELFTEEQPSFILASKTNRFFAVLIDYLIYAGLFALYMMNFGEKYTPEDGGVGYRIEGWPTLGVIAIWFVIIVLLEGLTGQSLGKMIFGIKSIKQDGTKASIGNVTARHLFDAVDFFPFFGIVGLIVASRNNLSQRIGDLVAKTIVVKK
jgi:uncharacterized RDD family membrane protein YckC